MFISQKKYYELYDKWYSVSRDYATLASSLRELESKHKELHEAYELVIKGEFEAAIVKAEVKNAANLNMYNARFSAINSRAAAQSNLLNGLGL
jgi:hypothetical protein